MSGAGGLLGRMRVNVLCFSFGFDFPITRFEKVLDEMAPWEIRPRPGWYQFP